MTLYVRLSGPQVTLQRQKRGSAICPKLRRGGLLPSLSLMFLSVAIASLGFFVITEVGIVQRTQVGDRLLRRLRHSTLVQSLPTASTSRASSKASIMYHSLFPKFKPNVLQEMYQENVFIEFRPPIDSKKTSGDFFKINPLLNKNAPSVELSAQMTLNAIYCNNIRKDILNYYESVRCKDGWKNETYSRENKTQECNDFTLVPKGSERKDWWSIKPCPIYPSNLVGQRKVAADEFLSINRIDPIVLKAIKHGGWWEPNDCLPRHSVAIVIPYKDRWVHLTTLLNYLHPLLQKQRVKYKIFVVEQYGNETFNKGTIMNAAFIEALKEELFHCFIFHDVDLIPENDYNMYSCPQMPRHLSVAVNELNYKLPYAELVGGAFAIRTEHFFKVNGYSNFFWGWGGEDDDMGFRVLQSGLSIIRPLPSLGKYTMIKHVKRKPSDARIRRRLLATSRKRYRLEGLNSVQYRLLKKKEFPWFTAFLVDIGKPHPSFNLGGKKD